MIISFALPQLGLIRKFIKSLSEQKLYFSKVRRKNTQIKNITGEGNHDRLGDKEDRNLATKETLNFCVKKILILELVTEISKKVIIL